MRNRVSGVWIGIKWQRNRSYSFPLALYSVKFPNNTNLSIFEGTDKTILIVFSYKIIVFVGGSARSNSKLHRKHWSYHFSFVWNKTLWPVISAPNRFARYTSFNYAYMKWRPSKSSAFSVHLPNLIATSPQGKSLELIARFCFNLQIDILISPACIILSMVDKFDCPSTL